LLSIAQFILLSWLSAASQEARSLRLTQSGGRF
jgi:hypothetical protein